MGSYRGDYILGGKKGNKSLRASKLAVNIFPSKLPHLEIHFHNCLLKITGILGIKEVPGTVILIKVLLELEDGA